MLSIFGNSRQASTASRPALQGNRLWHGTVCEGHRCTCASWETDCELVLLPDLQNMVCFLQILNGLSLRGTGTDNVTPVHVIVACKLMTAFISCAYLSRIVVGRAKLQLLSQDSKIAALAHLKACGLPVSFPETCGDLRGVWYCEW